MPDPKPLGYAARAVIKGAIELLEMNQAEFFEVVIHIRSGDDTDAIRALKEAASRNSAVVQALTLLLADRHHDAEELINRALNK